MSFLSDILETTNQAVGQRQRVKPLSAIQDSLQPRPNDHVFLDALREQGIAVIAEFKRASPSDTAHPHLDAQVEAYVGAYERGKARALSILTEESSFRGKLADLRLARQLTTLPLLRKDFIVDEYQVYEAADLGADAVLLIVAALRGQEGRLRRLYELARELLLDVLVEVRTVDELDRALAVGAELVGINNRNLDTFDVDVDTTYELVTHIPKDVTIVSESGLHTREELDRLESVGVDAALIGSVLMGDDDPEAKCRELASSGADLSAKRSASSEHPVLA
jgi:indole-3-glycerol phosphate synthase